MQWSHVAAVYSLVVIVACAPQGSRSSTDVAAVQQALDSLLEEHGRLAIAGNVDGIMNHYAPDAVVRSNHSEPLRGQEAIRAYVGGMLQTLTLQRLDYTTENLAVYGDSAWHIVMYRVAGTTGSQPIADSGSAFILWTRDSTRGWRIKEDILNSWAPLPMPPAYSR